MAQIHMGMRLAWVLGRRVQNRILLNQGIDFEYIQLVKSGILLNQGIDWVYAAEMA